LSLTTAARAGYAVAMFKDGTCRAWQRSKAAPLALGWKYRWVGLKSWNEAESKRHDAMMHRWCKSWIW
jgi:hypothetical protein